MNHESACQLPTNSCQIRSNVLIKKHLSQFNPLFKNPEKGCTPLFFPFVAFNFTAHPSNRQCLTWGGRSGLLAWKIAWFKLNKANGLET